MNYLNFFGLEEKPFELTPNPKYLYFSKEYREAFEHMLYGIRSREGFLVITGEIGTGKSTLLRALLQSLRKEGTKSAYIINPSLSAVELLQGVLGDFGLEVHGEMTKKQLVDRLNEFLLGQLRTGANAVLLIDEAQNLQPAVLEEIRLLTNLETEWHKLLQVVLFGQPQLRDMLEHPELEQLNQRVALRYHLKPLPRKYMPGYIRHRLAVAGNQGQVEFTSGAIRKVYGYSGGVPRLINKVCDKSLLAGYVERSRRINRSMVKRGIRTIQGTPKRDTSLLWRF